MLIEPVALSDFFLSFFSAALIILLATVYASLYAWAKISGRRALSIGAWLTYAALLICVGVFSYVNHFNDYWLVLSLLMALGYGWMPRLIWKLCAATHDEDTHNNHQSGGHHD
ncbi:hypothetical protein [Methylomonas rosea]|uniref:Uncharacterized protein n=1 Tax=Methylomonas rosea TaxID=2952227 RepID=A0ABT1TUI3_9GAMM|nr:hypothetical protein [Methylomonas sp. WSC-7]MCQ8118435.1 hypothetical protein [Methylomonas sp. WSC-7]